MRTDANLTIYSLTTEKNTATDEVLVLRKNGKICSCAYRNPVILPHPNIQGQMIIQNPVCSDGCQFFTIIDRSAERGLDNKPTEPKLTLHLSCSDAWLEVLIEKEKKSDESRPQDSPIIRL
jgi:hypothetical protein